MTTKSQRGFTLRPDVIRAARNTVAALRGRPDAPQTMSALVDEGITRVVTELQEQHNAGRPFPDVPRLPGGRPRRTTTTPDTQPTADTVPRDLTTTTSGDPS